MATIIYVVDANVYINAYTHYYRFKFKTKFWDILKRSAANRGGRRVVCIDRVKGELVKKTDDLSAWISGLPDDAFEKVDRTDILFHYTKLQNWVTSQTQYFPAAKAAFGNSTDAWIVAYAMAVTGIVVTHEALNPDIKRAIKIPNACNALGIRYINTFTMLDELNEPLG